MCQTALGPTVRVRRTAAQFYSGEKGSLMANCCIGGRLGRQEEIETRSTVS